MAKIILESNFKKKELVESLDRVAVCMTRCCLSLSDDERHMFFQNYRNV